MQVTASLWLRICGSLSLGSLSRGDPSDANSWGGGRGTRVGFGAGVVGQSGALPWAGLLPWGAPGLSAPSNPPTSFEILAGASWGRGSVTHTACFVSLESFYCQLVGEGALYCKFPPSNYVVMYDNPAWPRCWAACVSWEPGPAVGRVAGVRATCPGDLGAAGLAASLLRDLGRGLGDFPLPECGGSPHSRFLCGVVP